VEERRSCDVTGTHKRTRRNKFVIYKVGSNELSECLPKSKQKNLEKNKTQWGLRKNETFRTSLPTEIYTTEKIANQVTTKKEEMTKTTANTDNMIFQIK